MAVPRVPRLPLSDGILERVRGHRYSLGVMSFSLNLVLSDACSGRAAAAALERMVPWLPGPQKAPCANTARTWLLRLGLHELTCAKPAGDDWAWLVDHTVQLGPHKGLIVVGLRLGAWQESPRPLEHEDVRLLHLEPTEHSDGTTVHGQLDKVMARTGVPRQIVSDGGSDLRCGVRLFRQEHPRVGHSYDIKHKTALLLKKELEKDKDWDRFVSCSNLARRGLTLTSAAFLVPPGLKSKARYMNVDRLVAWGENVLQYLEDPRDVPGPAVDGRLVERRLGWLREYRPRLEEWSALLRLAEASAHYIRHAGYHADAAEELSACLEPLVTQERSHRMRDALLAFVAEQSSAAQRGERLLGSTEVLESIIGSYKRLQAMHSAGGMTGMVLGIGAIVGCRCAETIRAAMESVSNQDVRHWCREGLGITLQAQRRLAFAEQNRPPLRPAPSQAV